MLAVPYVADAHFISGLLDNFAEVQPMYARTQDHGESFYPKWVAMAERLEAAPLDLACVAFSESGMYARAANDGPPGKRAEEQYHASGLIQFMGPTLRILGWTYGYQAFRALTADAQLPYVERYFRSYIGRLTSRALVYTATFVPGSLVDAQRGGPDFVLVQKDGRLGWAYSANARAFDANGDYKITVQELENAIARNCVGPRWNEIEVRLRQAQGLEPAPPATDPGGFDLTTVIGVQKALDALGFHPGPVDGAPGTLTRSAVAAFQSSHRLSVDGIVGPITRQALDDALDADRTIPGSLA